MSTDGVGASEEASKFRGKCADDNHCSFSCLKDEPCLRSNYAAKVLAERAAAGHPGTLKEQPQ